MKKIKNFFASRAGKLLLGAVALLPALLALALAVYYILGPGEGYLHSDCTDSMYWANASYESGKVFDETYRYAALLPFSAGLWMTPLISVFGFGLTAHNIGMIIFAVLFAASIYFCCRAAKMGIGWSSAAVFAVFMILSSSDKLREILWGHAIYYSISMLIMFFLIGIAARWLDDEKKHSVLSVVLMSLAAAFLACGAATDGFQVIAISVVPVIAALIADRIFSGEARLTVRSLVPSVSLLAILMSFTLLGLILLSGFQGKVAYTFEYSAEDGAFLAESVGEDGPVIATSKYTGPTEGLADPETAKTGALHRAGIAEQKASGLKVKLRTDDATGKPVYVVTFSRPKIVSDYAAAYSGWSATADWVTNADKFLSSYLTLIGIPASMGGEMFSLESILSLIRIAAGGLILIVPIAMLCLYSRIRTRGTKLILWSYWVVFAVIMLGFICGKLSTANWRLTPIVGSAVLCTVAGLREAFVVLREVSRESAGEREKEADEKIASASGAARFAALLLAVLMLSACLTAKEVKAMPADFERDDVYHKCAAFLEEKGLEYGYASFWYSQIITMLSDSRAKTCEIMTNSSTGVYTDYYQSSRRWYEDDTHDKYFILLTNGEYDTVKNTKSWKEWTENYLIESYDRVDNYLLHVFVFSKNVLASN